MKSIIQKLSAQGIEISDLFKGFVQAISELEDERSQDADNAEEAEEAVADEGQNSVGIYDYQADAEDFPGRRYFDGDDLNGEDPAYWRGVEIGIPAPVAVHTNPRQNKILPLVQGVLIGED